jgi:predicted phage baseplate assembly protein
MSLPVPVLDDRRFQDLVDEAKRLIPRYCPGWTDHNLSDPGVTLIELFAWMTEMILYRVNKVPDLHFTKFLELMGIRLFSAAAARCDVAFWLSAPQPDEVRLHSNTQVGTVRTEQEESIVFLTDEDLAIVVPTPSACLTGTADGRYEDHWDDLRRTGSEVTCFSTSRPGDAIYFGFEQSLSSNIIRLDVKASIEGVGIVPTDPPWRWEVWSGEDWIPAAVHGDTSGGFNRDGAITLFVPRRHEPLIIGPARANWLRCQMTEATGDQRPYKASPTVSKLEAVSLGGIMSAHHAQLVPRERLGVSEGIAGQSFTVRRAPVLPRRKDETVVVMTSEGEQRWTEVRDFSASGPGDRHFSWDPTGGEISFGPLIHYPDGTRRQFGAVPPVGAEIFVTGYRFGGGSVGNVGGKTLTVLKTSIPFIASVENLTPAHGGVDAETIENAKARGPMTLRTGQRAVTVHDFERLTLEASSSVARARCLAPKEATKPIRVLIVPRVTIAPQQLVLDDLVLPDDLVEDVSDYLDERRLLTTSVEIGTPFYQGLTVTAQVRGESGIGPELLRDRLLTLLYRYINPLIGGPGGDGWPFGRELNVGEVFGLLSSAEGVTGVEEVSIYLADLRTRERRETRQRARLPDNAVFASFQHQVRVK